MNDDKPLASCPLCDSKIAPQPLEIYRKNYVVKCRDCGFTYSLLILSEADYARVYGESLVDEATRTESTKEAQRT